jgi:hypothetical protein
MPSEEELAFAPFFLPCVFRAGERPMKRSLVLGSLLAGSLVLFHCGKPETQGTDAGSAAADVGGGGGGADASSSGGADASPQAGQDAAATGADASTAGADASMASADGSTAASDGGATGACDPVKNTGCKAGEKCTFVDPSGTMGCGPAGAKGDYETCAGDGECKGGFFCTSVDGATFQCQAFCAASADCPQTPTKQLCNLSFKQGASPVLCSRIVTCDPVKQDCAKATDACYVTIQGPLCAGAGTTNTGDACAFANSCKKGDSCVSGKCQTVCDAAANPTTCPSGKKCTAAGPGLGVCQ